MPEPTLTVEEAVRRSWGVVVVGAGPAGSLSARELARRGVAVLLVDRATFPRWKVCGCCLSGRALATLARVGLGGLPARGGAIPLEATHLAVPGRSARLVLPGGMALSREALDTALIRAAIEAGADFLPRTRATLRPEQPREGGRLVDLHQGAAPAQVRASVVLAADGLGGNFLARAGVSTAPPAPGARIGAGVTVASTETFYRPGNVFLACGRGGYVGLVTLEDGRLDVAAALDVEGVRAGGLGAVAARLLGAVGWPVPAGLEEADWRGTVPLTRRAQHLAAPCVFSLGDAASYVEPFTGEGIGWALATAVAVAPLAAQAAHRWHPGLARDWANLYRQVVGRQYLCRALAAALRRPGLASALLGVVSHLPILATPFVRAQSGPARARSPLRGVTSSDACVS